MDLSPTPRFSDLPEELDSPDRYLTFRGIDFEGNMARVLGHLWRHVDRPGGANPFWERFRARLGAAEAGGAMQDKLLLMHSHVYYMVDLFEEHEDEVALADLKKLEEECF